MQRKKIIHALSIGKTDGKEVLENKKEAEKISSLLEIGKKIITGIYANINPSTHVFFRICAICSADNSVPIFSFGP